MTELKSLFMSCQDQYFRILLWREWLSNLLICQHQRESVFGSKSLSTFIFYSKPLTDSLIESHSQVCKKLYMRAFIKRSPNFKNSLKTYLMLYPRCIVAKHNPINQFFRFMKSKFNFLLTCSNFLICIKPRCRDKAF